jgi:polar amino acid transport system substrate-binding protein
MFRGLNYNLNMLRALIAYIVLLPIFVFAEVTQSISNNHNACDTLKVGGSDGWIPIAYVNSTTKQPDGLGYQLTRKLGKHLGVPVSIEPNFPWARIMVMASSGELDIIAGLVINLKRQKFLYFTAPFYRDTLYAFAHENTNIHLVRVEDLLSHQRVEVRGHSIGESLDILLREKTILVNNDAQLISLILSGRADYFIASQTDFSTLKRGSAVWHDFKQLSLPLNTLEVVLGVSKASPCAKYLNEFNRYISKHYSK